MSYTPTNWSCGDTITAEKLNKLENGLAECCGGGSEPLVVHVVDSEEMCGVSPLPMLDKTWQEIRNAFPNVYIENGNAIIAIYHIGQYQINDSWVANAANGYPTLECTPEE